MYSNISFISLTINQTTHKMARREVGAVDFEFLEILAEEDSQVFNWDLMENNLDVEALIEVADNNNELVDELGNLDVVGDGDMDVEAFNDFENVVVEEHLEDEGIEADTIDELHWIDYPSRFLTTNELVNTYCVSMVFVTILAVNGNERYICEECYIPYSLIVGNNIRHRHTDVHTTVSIDQMRRIYCMCCSTALFQLRRVQICNICNVNT